MKLFLSTHTTHNLKTSKNTEHVKCCFYSSPQRSNTTFVLSWCLPFLISNSNKMGYLGHIWFKGSLKQTLQSQPFNSKQNIYLKYWKFSISEDIDCIQEEKFAWKNEHRKIMLESSKIQSNTENLFGSISWHERWECHTLGFLEL